MKKIKKITKASLKKEARLNKRKALVAWSDAVKERDGYCCQICGIKKGELTKNGKVVVFNSHHLLAKEGTYSHLMFDISNGVCLCQRCHRYSRENSPHRQEFVFFNWFMKNKPEQFQKLQEKIIKEKDINNERT